MKTYTFTFTLKQYISILISLSLVMSSIPASCAQGFLAVPGDSELSYSFLDFFDTEHNNSNANMQMSRQMLKTALEQAGRLTVQIDKIQDSELDRIIGIITSEGSKISKERSISDVVGKYGIGKKQISRAIKLVIQLAEANIADKKDLEERFMNQCLLNIQAAVGFINQKVKTGSVLPAIGSISTILYISEFIKQAVGPSRQEAFISIDELSKFHLDTFRDIYKTDILKDKIGIVVSEIKNNRNYSNWFKEAASLLDNFLEDFDVLTHTEEAWKKLGLDRNAKDAQGKRLLEEAERFYSLIGSKVDLERRRLIEKLASNPDYILREDRKVKFDLLGIGLGRPCGKKCRHCFNILTHQDRLSEKVLDEIFRIGSKIGITRILVTGYEPFLNLEKIIYLVRHTKAEYIHITTNANFAVDNEKGGQTEQIVNRVWNSYRRNPGVRKKGLYIGISMDQFHQEIIRKEDESLMENIPISRVANLIEIIFRKFPDIFLGIFGTKSEIDETFVYLLEELSKRGINPVSESSTYSVHRRVVKIKQSKESAVKEWGHKKEVRFKGKYGERKIVYKAQPLIRGGHALTLNSWEYLHSVYTLQDYTSIDKYPALETGIIYINSDGHIYQGSDFEDVWSVGKIGEDNLENIIRQLERDPLARAINKNFGKVVTLAIEVDSRLKGRISLNPDGREVMIKIIKDPAMRLYLTKRLIWEEWQEGLCPEEVVKDLGLNIPLERLKEEYNDKKIRIAQEKDETMRGAKKQTNEETDTESGINKNGQQNIKVSN